MILSDSVKAIFNSMNEGILIIDPDENIVFGNTAYKKFINSEAGRDIGPIAGKKLRQLRPGAQLPDVLKTGIPIMHAPRRELAEVYFVNMYPIFEGTDIVAAMSVVTFIDDAESFKGELEAIERHNEQVRNSMNNVSGMMTFDRIIARGRKSAACKAYAERIAATEFPILLISESGAGKGAYAQAIHNASPRAGGVFISLNCATYSETLNVQLFGSEPGAVSGSRHGSMGLLEAAEGGTLFIDEISEMSLDNQSRLLRALQSQSIRRIGGHTDIPINVRIIAASNVNLTDYIDRGRFRDELFYHLNTFNITIPPLRERMDDLPPLVRQILHGVSRMMKKPIGITDGAMDRLMAHNWPGNVRELINVLEFSAYLSKNDMITEDSLPENIGTAQKTSGQTLSERVKAFERSEIMKTLETFGNDLPGKKAAAQELGISLASLYSKLK